MHGPHRSSGIERLDRGMNRGGDRGFERDDGPRDVRIVVTTAPGSERISSYLPWPMKLALRLGLVVAGLFAVFVLPHYLDCRSQRDSGLFYYGMTVATCTRQTAYGQIGAAQRQFEDIARAIGGR